MMDPAAMVTVKLRYVHQDVDRHGNVRTDFWRKGGPKIRIRESIGTQAFLDVYRDLLADSQSGRLEPAKRPVNMPEPGTCRWFCVEYFKSARFTRLGPRTQWVRRRVLELTCEEPIYPGAKEKFGDCPLGSKARLALALLMWTGARRSDVVLLGKPHVRDRWLKFTQQKNRNRKRVTIEIPVLPDLQRVIDAIPTGDLTFLVSERRRPFAVSAFGNWFRTRCDKAGLRQCSAHGPRKAGATIAAENGATEHQLMAIFGWATSKEAERYTKTAQRKKTSGDAMSLLVRPKDEQKFPTSSRRSRR